MSTERLEKWWLGPDIEERWNGVFQGGGAKGVAYAGALKAVCSQRRWFDAVAGSSAGAITASLIAAGLSPEHMKGLVPAGLRSVKWATWLHLVAFIGNPAVPIFEVHKLAFWLEEIFQKQVAGFNGTEAPSLEEYRAGFLDRTHNTIPLDHFEDAITFDDLYQATAIELYVVCLDVDGGAPVVLSRRNAGQCRVTSAVVASSALPLAMPERSLTMSSHAGRWRTTRIVDGGGWANYPRFVFEDPSFMTVHGNHACAQRPTVGFALQISREQPQQTFEPLGFEVPAQRPEGSVEESPAEFQQRASWRPPLWSVALLVIWMMAVFAAGAALLIALEVLDGGPLGAADESWRQPAAWMSGAALVILLLPVAKPLIVGGFRNHLFRTFALLVALAIFVGGAGSWLSQQIDSIGDESTLVSIASLLAAPFGIAIVIVAFLFVLRFHGWLAGLAVATASAISGAATKLPHWAGADPDDHLVRVPVDPRINTWSFKRADEMQDDLAEKASEKSAPQLAAIIARIRESQAASSDRLKTGSLSALRGPPRASGPRPWRPSGEDLNPIPKEHPYAASRGSWGSIVVVSGLFVFVLGGGALVGVNSALENAVAVVMALFLVLSINRWLHWRRMIEDDKPSVAAG